MIDRTILIDLDVALPVHCSALHAGNFGGFLKASSCTKKGQGMVLALNLSFGSFGIEGMQRETKMDSPQADCFKGTPDGKRWRLVIKTAVRYGGAGIMRRGSLF